MVIEVFPIGLWAGAGIFVTAPTVLVLTFTFPVSYSVDDAAGGATAASLMGAVEADLRVEIGVKALADLGTNASVVAMAALEFPTTSKIVEEFSC